MTFRTGHCIEIKDATRIDCAIFDSKWGVYGQSWHVDVAVFGELNAHGFIADFSSVKKTLKKICDESFDHALVVAEQSKNVQIQFDNQNVLLELRDDMNLLWTYECPAAAVQFVKGPEINIQQMELELSKRLQENLPDNVAEVRVYFREEEKADGVFFRYSHGLYNYEGLCRRIFHGHRSLVEVKRNGAYCKELSQYAVDKILNERVHIACLPQKSEATNQYTRLCSNDKGSKITASVPTSRVLMLAKETSIEYIAGYVAEELRQTLKIEEKLEVKIYEGIEKSASVFFN